MGRDSPTLGIPYQKKENDTDLSGRDARTLGGQGDVNGTKSKYTPLHNKPHFFEKNQEKITKKETRETTKSLPVRGVHPQSGEGHDTFQQKQEGIRVENAGDTDPGVVSLQCCPNTGTYGVSTSLGQLFRVGTLARTNWTTEEPTTPCCLIQPDHIFTQNADGDHVPVHQVPAGSGQDEPHGHCKNSLMVVEKIKNGSDAHRIVKSIWYTLIKKESDVTVY